MQIAKIKPRKLIKALLSINLLALDVIVGTLVKQTAAYTPELREHSYHTESVIHQYFSTCKQLQLIKSPFRTIYPDDDAKSNQTSI